ncbi:NAD(P)H-dependent oxidoreductase [Roseibium salinum]|nr:NAD(P)H-dependent oxidoreductase [Roseibium salinum]
MPLQVGDPAAEARLCEALDGMDGFVVVTPEYNHAAPGPLKSLIDAAKAEWEARPVGLISYGGISGGLRAAETLRPVFAELHAMTLRDTVSFAMPFNKFDENGELKDPADAKRADAAMVTFGNSLAWWAQALQTARNERPYGRRAA